MHDTGTLNTFPAGFQTTASELPQVKCISLNPSLKNQNAELTQLDNLRIHHVYYMVPPVKPSTRDAEPGGLRV